MIYNKFVYYVDIFLTFKNLFICIKLIFFFRFLHLTRFELILDVTYNMIYNMNKYMISGKFLVRFDHGGKFGKLR